MAVISLQDAMDKASVDEFWAIRGKAIQAYASLEQAMATLLGVVAGTDLETATIIFFKIASADSRNRIIEKLFQKKYQTDYNLFRNSLIKQLGPIDRERNEIVHWNVVNVVGAGDDGKATALLQLVPPSYWKDIDTSPKKTSADLVAFSKKCDFYTRLVNMFTATVGKLVPNLPEDIAKEWEQYFVVPIVYPPPASHPLQPQDINPTQTFQLT